MEVKGWRRSEENAEGRPTFDIERNELDTLYNSGAHVELSASSKLHVILDSQKEKLRTRLPKFQHHFIGQEARRRREPRQMWAVYIYIYVERLV